jgi:hypothetical protein
MDSAAERKRKLIEKMESGRRAEDFLPFVDEFQKIEQETAITNMLQTSKDPAQIKADLNAAVRLVGYIHILVNEGKIAKKQIEGMKKDE